MSRITNENIEIAFMAAFDKLPKIPCDPSWSNGTGYFDGAVKADIDEVCASQDEHGRQVIIVPQRKSPGGDFNIVYFRRYTNSDVFIVHGTKLAYLKSIKRFAVVGKSACGLWEPEVSKELELLQDLQYAL